jgi:hypothetical protein
MPQRKGWLGRPSCRKEEGLNKRAKTVSLVAKFLTCQSGISCRVLAVWHGNLWHRGNSEWTLFQEVKSCVINKPWKFSLLNLIFFPHYRMPNLHLHRSDCALLLINDSTNERSEPGQGTWRQRTFYVVTKSLSTRFSKILWFVVWRLILKWIL